MLNANTKLLVTGRDGTNNGKPFSYNNYRALIAPQDTYSYEISAVGLSWFEHFTEFISISRGKNSLLSLKQKALEI